MIFTFRLFILFILCFSQTASAAFETLFTFSRGLRSSTVQPRSFCMGQQKRCFSTPARTIPRYGEIAVERYISDSRMVNEPLRRGDIFVAATPLVHNLDLALRLLEPCSSSPLYRVEQRSLDFIRGLKRGMILCPLGYYSTSRNREFFEIAHRYPFFGSEFNVRYVIERHFSGKYISHFSPNRNQEGPLEIQEVLFPRESPFRILEIDWGDGIATLRMEEVESENQVAVKAVESFEFKVLHEDLI